MNQSHRRMGALTPLYGAYQLQTSTSMLGYKARIADFLHVTRSFAVGDSEDLVSAAFRSMQLRIVDALVPYRDRRDVRLARALPTPPSLKRKWRAKGFVPIDPMDARGKRGLRDV